MHVKSLILPSITLLSCTTASLDFNLADLGSVSQLTYRDLGSMFSLETRSLTDRYDVLTSRGPEASARSGTQADTQAAPSGIVGRALVRAAGEVLGVPDRWLPVVGEEEGKTGRGVVRVREVGPEEGLQATLVHRIPTPCSHSESVG